MHGPTRQQSDREATVRVRGRPRSYVETYVEKRRISGRDYFILERVGSPFRERHLAFDPRTGPGGDFFLVERWREEVSSNQRLAVLRRLKDDCFPRVWAWQCHDEYVDVVMTWVEGVALDEYQSHVRTGRRPPIDSSHALRLVCGVAAAVSRLHHKLQVAHGDIQPSNIVLTNHPSRLVLIDFGSAWTMQQSAFRQDGDGHNRCYAAPELQNQKTAAGFTADQFSVSAVLFELLTLQLPYGGLGGKAGRPEFSSRAGNSLVPPSEVSPACAALPRSLRELLDRIVMRGLALDPDNRYPDRHAWLDDMYQAAARFRMRPELSTGQHFIARLVRRLLT
jgi:serine/threonine protein kinase